MKISLKIKKKNEKKLQLDMKWHYKKKKEVLSSGNSINENEETKCTFRLLFVVVAVGGVILFFLSFSLTILRQNLKEMFVNVSDENKFLSHHIRLFFYLCICSLGLVAFSTTITSILSCFFLLFFFSLSVHLTTIVRWHSWRIVVWLHHIILLLFFFSFSIFISIAHEKKIVEKQQQQKYLHTKTQHGKWKCINIIKVYLKINFLIIMCSA